MRKNVLLPLIALALILGLSIAAFADTIRMKDGSIYKGKVVGFKDQQFTILIGNPARGRQSRLILYIDDIDSIEFDSSTGTASTYPDDDGPATYNPPATNPRPTTNTNTGNTRPNTNPPATNNNSGGNPRPNNPPATNNSGGNNSGGNNTGNNSGGAFFPIKVRVTGDNTTNGWTNTGFVVRKGQRLRISASGRVMLGNGRFSTPGGISTLPDASKLMSNEPTGALIAVIGDNNNDFVFIGARREFVASQDGYLFLGVNENNLDDNTGAYDAVLEVEAGNP
ncbi:MAG: hypothetical protein ABIP75_04300 [Pyrinomonadaceae bacterium]